jgi:hypothetical protein
MDAQNARWFFCARFARSIGIKCHAVLFYSWKCYLLV